MTRINTCTPGIAEGRLRKAEEFLDSAQALALVRDEGEPSEDAEVTLLVHAGIAAADVICCRRLGRHARGQDHTVAVQLLRQVDRSAARDLDTLLRRKTRAGYSAQSVSGTDLKKARRAAAALVETARRSG